VSVSRDEVSETKKAYTAGLIDGEGSIFIARRKKKTRYYYEPTVMVGNTDKAMIDYLTALYGGWVTKSKTRWKSNTDLYFWGIAGDSMRQFLKDILPYLVGKRKHARLVLRFPVFPPSGLGQERPKNIVRRQASIYKKVKELNRKGVT